MEWMERMNRTMDYIEENLSGSIDPEQIARIMACPYAVFQRGFGPIADEKGLEGCWLCTELDGCAKGYYGNQDEYVAKATAMFIRKHGKETYTEALRRAVEAGENYPKSFDAQGSVEAALRLLEQYR